VLAGRDAAERGDLRKLGRLMVASHHSSRDLFGNSCAELDLLVDTAQEIEGLLGAKLSGGGFGGATVNLVEAAKLERFAAELAARIQRRTGRPARTLLCPIGGGARAWRG
jgi:galactokinase